MALAQYGMDHAATTQAKVAARKEYDKQSKAYDAVIRSIAALSPDKPSLQNARSLYDVGCRQEESQKKIFRLSKMMNRFTQKSIANEYWLYFNEQCETYNLTHYESILLMQAIVVEHPNGPLWYSNNVHPRSKEMTRLELQELFFLEFLDSNWRTERMIALLGITYRSETVKEFIHRFSTLMRGTGFLWEGTKPEHAFLKHVFYYKCPHSVQRLLNGRTPDDFNDCSSLAKVLMTYPAIPEDVLVA